MALDIGGVGRLPVFADKVVLKRIIAFSLASFDDWFGSKADVLHHTGHVRYGPIADIATITSVEVVTRLRGAKPALFR